jgi:ABC-type cobalt transport system substrate-binding protein
MKKFLSILLLLVLVSAVTVVAVSAGASDTYWSVSDECLVEVKQLKDGTVPTFKNVIVDEEYGDYEE